MEEVLVSGAGDHRYLVAAVDEFARQHDSGMFVSGRKKYQALLPQQAPGPGQQYAFEVDLDKCTGCKACVTACHNENGLDDDETWRSVGLIHGGSGANAAVQHVTTACHHCVEPACLKGCPTLAYTKDEATGIVKHLDDQCFGCQYCLLTCPYNVPQYNKKRGIVHKCDMCAGRLKDGQAPACVRACPNGAICIRVVDQGEVKRRAREYVAVPDAPASDYTYPTTRYKTNRVFPGNMMAVDYHVLKPEHSHLPLVFMLVWTQLSVGAFGAEILLKAFMNPHFMPVVNPFHAGVALGLGLLALGASIFHLGRPYLAFRAFLGFRTSWLSREIIAFGAFAQLAILYVFFCGVQPLHAWFGRWYGTIPVLNFLEFAVTMAGLVGILCSVRVYQTTRRPFWDNGLTLAKFLMTTVLLGCTTVLMTSVILGAARPEVPLRYIIEFFGGIFCQTILSVSVVKLMMEACVFLIPDRGRGAFLRKTAVLMATGLRPQSVWRFVCGLIGGVVLPLVFLQGGSSLSSVPAVVVCVLMFGLLLAGELLERYLFFRAVVPLKLPGGNIS